MENGAAHPLQCQLLGQPPEVQPLWWSGFSGQGPSLTSEAGHSSNQGLPNDEQLTNPQSRVQGKGRYGSDQRPQDPSADCRRPCGAPYPGEPVEATVA